MIIFEKAILLIITYLFLYLTTSVISEKKIKVSFKDILLVLVVIALNVFVFKLTNGVIKGVITLIGFFIYARLCFKSSFKEAIVTSFVMYLYVVIGEIISSLILVSLKLDSFIANSSNLGIYKLLFSSVYTLLLYLFTFIPFIKNKLIWLKRSIINFKYIFHALILIFFVFEISIMIFLFNTSSQLESFLSIVLIIIITLGVSTIIYQFTKNNELSLLNENLKQKNESFLKVLNNYKMFKHNMKHELNAISAMGNKKVKDLVKEYIKEYDSDVDINIDDIIKMPDGIKEIMYQKIIESKNLPCNISVDNNLNFDPFEKINIKKYCRLNQCIGIIFDNAIEAAKDCENSFVYIRLFENNGSTFIEVSNNFVNDINLDLIGREERTTKDNHTGIGLLYISKQKDLNIESKIRNNIYTAKIKIN